MVIGPEVGFTRQTVRDRLDTRGRAFPYSRGLQFVYSLNRTEQFYSVYSQSVKKSFLMRI